MNPIDDAQSLDFFTLAGVDSPGVIPPGGITGFDREFSFDIKQGKGAIGATTTFTGQAPAEGTIKLQLWLPAHFDAWTLFVKMLKIDPTKAPASALDIYHPSLVDLAIRAVQVKKITPLIHEGAGLYTVAITLIEYIPAKKTSAVSTASGSKGSDYTSKPSPGQQVDQTIDALEKEIKSLSKQAQQAGL